jgi:hypothetical protein
MIYIYILIFIKITSLLFETTNFYLGFKGIIKLVLALLPLGILGI